MKNILSILIVLFFYYTALAQNSNQQSQINPPQLPNIVPPSPSVANLMRFDELPVNYYTGQPDISLPLVSAQSKDFSIPISLSYSTLGNRVDERSGIVGTGWSISGDIVISRTVMGIRDDKYPTQAPFNYGIYFTGYEEFGINGIPNTESFENYLWNTEGFGSSKYPIDLYSNYKRGGFDKEYDLFHLNLNGLNAKFIITKQNNAYKVNYLSNDNNLIIKVYSNLNDITGKFEIDFFEVIDNQGRRYILNQKEKTRTTTFSSIVPHGQFEQPTLIGTQDIHKYTSAWKVKEVLDYKGETLVEYKYNEFEESLPLSRNITKHDLHPNNKDHIYQNYLGEDAEDLGTKAINQSILEPQKIYSFNHISIESLKIDEINLTDNSRLNFYYKSDHPEYQVSTGAILDSISLKKLNSDGLVSNEAIKSVKIEYDSVPTINTNQFVSDFKRLYLKNLKVYGGDTSDAQTYKIIYNEYLTEGFGSIHKDYWGYYKKPYNPGTPMIFRTDRKTADIDNVTKGLISHIEYPNGGIKKFIFESNDFYHIGSRELSLQEYKRLNPNNWIKQTINLNNTGTQPNQETITIYEKKEFTIRSTATYNHASDPGDTGIYGPSDGDSSGAGSEDSNYSGNMDSGTPGLTLFEIIKIENNQETRIGAVRFDYDDTVNQNLTLEPGTYVFRFHPESQTSAQQRVNIYYLNFKPLLDKEVPGGGVRVKEVIFQDSKDNTTPKYHKKYLYSESIPPNIINYSDTISFPQENLPTIHSLNETSSGVTDGFLANIKKYSISKRTYLAEVMTVHSVMNTYKPTNPPLYINYEVTEELNSVYATLTQNSYVGYEDVWVTHMDGSKEHFEYSSPRNYPSYPGGYKFPFLPAVDTSIYQGKLSKSSTFDNDSKIIMTKELNYDFISNKLARSIFTYKGKEKSPSSTSNFIMDNVIICPWPQFYETYEDYINKDFYNRKTDWITFADQLWNYSNFFFNCQNYETDRPYDSSVNYKFKNHNFMKSLQKEIKTTNYYYNADGSLADTLTQISDTDYWSNTYQPKSTTTTTYSSNNEVVESSKQVMFYPYNTPAWYSWNTQALVNTNRIAEPVAVETFNTDKLTSKLAKVYSSPTDISPIQNSTNSTNSIFELSEVLFAKSNQALDSKIKYEQYDQDSNVLQVRQTGDVPISYIYGYHNSKPIAKLVNIAYNQINPSLISSLQAAADADANCLGANCQQTEDDLRNLLEQLRSTYSNAQITTYTYDPLIGVTSVTDPRGQSLYYEYGAFNRLERIKDEQGHIVEEYDYNYRQTSNQ
ncbi:RHS repeat protein [Psychroflexus sp. ALD_RP9]|uniref:RHS repeat protein n=1 Tax=Psychroflexus sp. ALD_RP9 TaxID=2777186 RepID=UPI001A8E2EA5|nr:RHS repeat protein [Psychroflexus sp. ALD_RP9]QSS96314.1 RHS repeat protein [Psychroflexus sp. ALD_RP9]